MLVGLRQGAVGGSAIEFWLPPGDVNTTSACGKDDPPCDNNHNITDSQFFERLIRPLQPYTLGAVVWDQGERDTHCFSAPGTLLTHIKRYPCLERRLISSWSDRRACELRVFQESAHRHVQPPRRARASARGLLIVERDATVIGGLATKAPRRRTGACTGPARRRAA